MSAAWCALLYPALLCPALLCNRCSLRMAENFSSRPEVDRSGRKVSAIPKKRPPPAKNALHQTLPAGQPASPPINRPLTGQSAGQPADRPAGAANRPTGQLASLRAGACTMCVCVCADSPGLHFHAKDGTKIRHATRTTPRSTQQTHTHTHAFEEW